MKLLLSPAPAVGAPRPELPDLRRAGVLAGLGLGAVLAGAVAVVQPLLILAALGGGAALLLAFRFPVAHLMFLVVLTGLVPLAIQSRFGTGGSVDSAGAIPSDVIVLAGLARAAVALRGRRLDRRQSLAVWLLVGFLAGAAGLQLLHAMQLGRSISGVGAEVRVMLAFGTMLMALPLLEEAGSRRRLLRGLMGIGLLAGLWGIAQFALGLHFDAADDLGGSSSIAFTTAGRVVGMYLFPIVAILALATLTADGSGRRTRSWALVVLAVNCMAIVLTFERTFLVATLVGFAVLAVRTASPAQRRRVLVAVPATAVVAIGGLALLDPKVIPAARERFASIGSYSSDPSVAYRVAESRLVADEVRSSPVFGSGLGAAIYIGRPGTNEPIKARRYAENGYLWLAWKVGIPIAALLGLLIVLAIFTRPSRGHDPPFRGVIAGSQAALAALALATVTFGSFSELAITPVIGILLALCFARPPDAGAAPTPGAGRP